MSARWRELLAIGLVVVVVGVAVASWIDSRRPDEVDRIVERVMVRLVDEDVPGGVAVPSPSPSCQTVTVIDDYGFEVPITECDPASS